MKKLGCAFIALLLIAGVAAAWYMGGGLMRGDTADAPVEVSPEAADAAEAKLTDLVQDGEEARLSEVEVSSLLRYRTPGLVGGFVHEPVVELIGDTVRIVGEVSTDSLPSHPELDAVRPILPDRAPVEVVGRVESMRAGRVAFTVDEIQLAGIPIPDRYHEDLLRRIGREDEAGLSSSAIAVALPAGVGAVRVEDGFLILTP